MKTVISAIYNMVASMSPGFRVFMGVGSVALAINNYINELWAELFARVDAMAVGATGMADFSPLGMVNYIFPLDTVLTFLTAYATLRAACAAIRVVKSFIPTIS